MNGDYLEPGDVIEYEIKITNNGTDTATNVVFTDDLPLYTQMIPGSAVPSYGTVTQESPLILTIDELAPGETVTVYFQVILADDVPAGTEIESQGRVQADGGIEVLTDDPAAPYANDPTKLVIGREPVPHIYDPPDAFKTFSGDRPVIEWRMRWINDSNVDAILVHIEDPVPADGICVGCSVGADYGTTWYDEETNTVIWEGDIPGNGGEVNIWYQTVIPDDVDRLENQACAFWDRNGNGDWRDEEAEGLTEVCTDDPDTSPLEDPTVWTDAEEECPDCDAPFKPF
jgi:uncharacterized repeat protein (TIGR01451 family)